MLWLFSCHFKYTWTNNFLFSSLLGNLMDADRVGCYKGRKTGFPGLACKHCVGQAGCGRYFPASEASLSQTTTSQTIVNHVRNCRRCPIDIREQLEFMKMSKAVIKKVRDYARDTFWFTDEHTF